MLYELVYGLILLGLVVAVWRMPGVAIAAILCVQVLDFWGQMSSAFVASYPRATNLFMICLVGLGIASSFMRHRGLRWMHTRSMLVLGAMLGYVFLTILWTPVPDVALGQWAQYGPYIALSVVIAPFVIVTVDDMRRALTGLIVLGAILALVVDVFVKWQDRFVVSFWNPDATFWNALAFAQMAGYVTLAAVLSRPRTPSRTWMVFRFAAVMLCMILAVKSGSRGQFILMVGLSLLGLPMSQNKNNWRTYLSIIVGMAFVGAVSYVAFNYFAGDSERWSQSRFDADLEGRMNMAKELFRAWSIGSSQHAYVFLFGLGNSASFSSSIIGYYPHMVPLEVLAEEGVMGILFLGFVIAFFLYRSVQGLRLAANRPSERATICVLAAMFAFALLLSFKQGSLANICPELFLFVSLMERFVTVLSKGEARPAPDQARSVVPRYSNIVA